MSESTMSLDVVVVGSGPGGYVAAIRASQLGLRTAIIEQYPTLGGTCLNVGCIPSKALLESSERFYEARHGFSDHGIRVEPVLDLPTMMARKARIVRELTDGIAGLMKKNKIAVHHGHGTLLSPRVVQVQGEGDPVQLEAANIILATGSKAAALPFLPFDDARVLNSTGALSLTRVPGHLVVVGAGAVGLELGSVWRRLGADVTVLELLPQIAPFADRQMQKTLQRALKEQGLEFRLKTRLTGAEVRADSVVLSLETEGGKAETLACDQVLVCVGRKPNTRDLGLQAAGVELLPSGQVKVDEALRTTAPSVWAIGDLVSGPMLAHKAEEEGVAVAERIAGLPGHVNYLAIPSIIYTDPELAGVGRTEEQLKEQGIPYRVGRFLFRANGRAKALGAEEGMVKVLAHAETDKLLGVHAVGARVSELIAEAVVALELHASAEDLARTVHAHPTLSEIVKEAALAVDGRAIHA